MFRRLLLILCALAASVVFAAAAVDDARAWLGGAVPRFERAPCPGELPALKRARCGFLIVPESRGQPRRRTIQLAVAIVPAVASKPAPDPLVYLAGGPGGIPFLEAQRLVDARFNRDRDVILMAQRGTLYSKPALTCPVIDEFNRRALGLAYDVESTRRLHVTATRTCHDRLLAMGVDLSAYNTTENAADFADLRRALGYAQWNVFGVSYGTDLALVLMRTHPEGIRSVVLDSTVPPDRVTFPAFWPNARDGFQNLFRACFAQVRCRTSYPRLEDTFTRLVRTLEARPTSAIVKGSPGLGLTKVEIDGGAVANWLVSMSFATPAYKDVPLWIARLASGKADEIAASRAALVTPPGYIGYGLTFGVFCRESFPFGSKEQILAAARKVLPAYPASVLAEPPQFTYMPDDCRIWNVPAVPASFREPTRSRIPVLFVSGTFDAVTPPRWAKAAAATLPNAKIVEISGVGHFATPESKCAQTIVASFLLRPAAPDMHCARAQRVPAFTRLR